MDLSKLSRNEKLAALGAAMAVVGGLVAASTWRTYGIAWIGILAGVAMLGIVLQPQLAPKMTLPGSRGSLMVIVGGIAGVIMALGLLSTLTFIFVRFGVADLLFLVAIAGALLMGYAGWQAFQAEGGKLRIGGASAAAPSTPESQTESPASTSAAPDEPRTTAEPPSPPSDEERGTDEAR